MIPSWFEIRVNHLRNAIHRYFESRSCLKTIHGVSRNTRSMSLQNHGFDVEEYKSSKRAPKVPQMHPSSGPHSHEALIELEAPR